METTGEEEKGEKRLRAVTEEVSAPADGEDKTEFVVPETDNIEADSKVSQKGAFLKIFVVTFFATLLAFVVAGGVYVYLTGIGSFGSNKGETTGLITPEPVATLAPTPSATPQSSVDLSLLKISVLNGNGGIGVATALKNIIEKVGFKVASVGNADNFDFKDTLIQVKPSVAADVVAKLKSALANNYSVKIGDQLDPDSSYDIVITVGAK